MSRLTILVPPTAWDTVDSWDKGLKSRFIKTCRFVSVDPAYPSLHTEKIKGPGGEPLLRCRIDDAHRIHFSIPEGGRITIRDVGGHRLGGIG